MSSHYIPCPAGAPSGTCRRPFLCTSCPAPRNKGHVKISMLLFYPLQLCPTLCNPIEYSPLPHLSMGICRQEYWSGLPFPSPGDFPDPGLNRVSCIGRWMDSLPLCHPGTHEDPNHPPMRHLKKATSLAEGKTKKARMQLSTEVQSGLGQVCSVMPHHGHDTMYLGRGLRGKPG